ncbi:MAG: AAC(3) family N-acetyltransferase [Candidatus Ratteibacteria bacterium]
MDEIYNSIEKLFAQKRWKDIALKIYEIEKRFCYRDFEKSAVVCKEELEKSGAKYVQLIKLNADGETVYGDFIMPQAWNFEHAQLEIVEPGHLAGKILADTDIHPFHIANRSTALEQALFNVVDIKKMHQYTDLSGSFVFCGNIHPRECRHQVEKTGATGIISSFSKASDKKEGIFWVNGWVINSGWYHTKQDRKMVCFSISPSTGELLQRLLDSGNVMVKATVKSKTYDGSIFSITGLIPGKRKQEICFLSHLYEPMITDNATSVAGLIELCRVFNKLIEEKKFVPEFGIRFLFSMERYGMMQFFEKKHNVIYAFNVDSICDDILKTESMKFTFYGSPIAIPFFGDWIFEKLLLKHFHYSWKQEIPSYEDDSFISDSSIGIPSGYFLSHPGKLHHNSLLSEAVNWKQGKEVLCVLGTYVFMLCSNDFRKSLANLIKITAMEELYSCLSKIQMLISHFSARNIENRVSYMSDYIRRKYLSLAIFGIRPEKNFQSRISGTAKKFMKEISEKASCGSDENLSREDKKAKNIIVTWRKPLFIFSLAGIPHSARIHPPETFWAVINRVDGKKDLLAIYQEMCFEREQYMLPPVSEQEKNALTKYILYLAKYNYVKVKYRTVVSKEQIKATLRKLGIKKGDRIIVHSSLSSIGYVKGGAETVCRALMEIIGKNGILMMPSFNHGLIFEKNPDAYFSPLETPTINGAIPDAFWRIKGVYRSLNPTHSFAVWGNRAIEFVKDHHKVLTMGNESPLQLLEKAAGKIVLIDTPTANTFHHVVEMTNNVPCLGQRTEEYPVKLPSGKIVKIRTWGWRDGVCEITDKGAYFDYMLKHNLFKKGQLGNASVYVVDMKICRKVIEKFLKGKIKGFGGCQECSIRPRKVACTVESDWDQMHQKVKPDTTAFIGDYEIT